MIYMVCVCIRKGEYGDSPIVAHCEDYYMSCCLAPAPFLSEGVNGHEGRAQ